MQFIVVLTPHSGNFSFLQTEIIIVNHNQSKHRVVGPSPSRCIYKTLPHLWLREHYRRGGRSIIRSRGSGSLLWHLCLLEISEVAPMKSHQHDSPNVRWTRKTNRYAKWMGRSQIIADDDNINFLCKNLHFYDFIVISLNLEMALWRFHILGIIRYVHKHVHLLFIYFILIPAGFVLSKSTQLLIFGALFII